MGNDTIRPLKRILENGTKPAASILQLRVLRDNYWRAIENDFGTYSWAVSVDTSIYSTSLYNHSYLYHDYPEVIQFMPPKYALHQAAGGGFKEAITQLIEDGATPLHHAARHGRLEVRQLLIAQGCEADSPGGMYGRPLHVACLGSFLNIIKLLLDHKSNTNTQSKYLNTTLTAAALSGHTGVMKLLMERGANVNLLGCRYGTPLPLCVQAAEIGVICDNCSHVPPFFHLNFSY